jgi:hypothetical protein
MLGAAMALGSLSWLAAAMDLPGREFFDMGPRAWLIVWAILAIVGFAIQMSSMRKPAPAKAPEPQPAKPPEPAKK